MIQVAIIGFSGALASAMTGMMDLFRLAGVTWARIQDEEPDPQFHVRLLTRDGRPCRCINGITLDAHGRWQDADQADLVIVPTIGGPMEHVLSEHSDLLPHLAQQVDRGAALASNCTGAFLLAEAGVLDGRTATTHWGFADHFRARYPQVDCHPERLITVDGPVACAGGGMAWWDLGVYLVAYYAGDRIARELSRSFVIDAGRQSQAPYATLQSRRYHQDPVIDKLQSWLEEQFHRPLDTADLCEVTGLGERSLLRRFQRATGDTPRHYIQLLRVEAARRSLESTNTPLARITQAVGYDDVSSFSRLFRKHTGLSPGQYRARFGR
ncbi:AraC family transcriptional regulator [Tamilnaduibacter salinus]|uniref:AraC family transcriptional regulator n=1 Tax=Tamilnaduibacter salinus TaxID=1484056 RepID=A0A2A2I2K9_9GAMM|nr:helix-turn-helix domain-containing protein [Tamilnaduibacter salinus]PAV25263.1 AraC family transcriptional regulator [Tamilnaduibacter salinus]